MKPLRITVWGINYSPELTGIAPYNTALCEFLKSRAHEVRMVTSFPYYPEWRKRDEDRWKIFQTDTCRGVQVHRCWHYVPRKPSALKRIVHELSFAVTSLLRVLLLPRPDLFVVISPPLFLGVVAWIASVMKRSPFVFHVQDLQPDAAASLGMVKGPVLRALFACESFAYRQAIAVSGISAGMLRAFERKGVPRHKTVLFPNGIELPASNTLPARGAFRRRMGFSPNEILAVYSGNLGVKHGVEILLDAAQQPDAAAVRTVICGDGARREALEAQMKNFGLTNVTFLPLQPEREYLEMLADTDIYLVTQQPGAASLFFPSKLLKGLAMSKPVLLVADDQSDLTHAARDHGFGIVVGPRRPKELAAAEKYLANSAEEREARGKAGRAYVEQFELGRILAQFETTLRAIAAATMPPTPSVEPAGARAAKSESESVR